MMSTRELMWTVSMIVAIAIGYCIATSKTLASPTQFLNQKVLSIGGFLSYEYREVISRSLMVGLFAFLVLYIHTNYHHLYMPR